MGCKSMLLGGAMILALSGAAGAQQTAPSTNTAPAATQTAPAQSSNTSGTESTSTPTKHATHHARHHHARHMSRTASLHSPSTPAEKRQTNDLNRQQLQAAESAASQPAGTPASYNQPQQGEMGTGNSQQPQGAAPGTEPGSTSNMQPATGTQQPPGAQPGNSGPYYQQPQNGGGEPGPSYMSAPGANGPVGSSGNPTTPADQNGPSPGTTTPQPSNPPGPSS